MIELTSQEQRFLNRQIRNKKNYLIFSIVGVVVALAMAVYYMLNEGIDGVRFALIMVILIGARGNLKQHKDAMLLAKLYQSEQENVV